MPAHHNIAPPRPSVPAPEQEAALDEALVESFPASDPPNHSQLPKERRRVEPSRELPLPLTEQDEEVMRWSPTSQQPKVVVLARAGPLPTPPEAGFDLVDAAGAESFPASDPPAWTLGRERG